MNSPDDPDGARRWWLGLALAVFFLVDFARPHLLECVRIRAYNAQAAQAVAWLCRDSRRGVYVTAARTPTASLGTVAVRRPWLQLDVVNGDYRTDDDGVESD